MIQWQKKKKKAEKTKHKLNQTKQKNHKQKSPTKTKQKKGCIFWGWYETSSQDFVFFPQKDGILHTFIGAR